MKLFCQSMQVCENYFTEIVREGRRHCLSFFFFFKVNFRNHFFCIVLKKEYAIVEEKEIGSEIIAIYLSNSKTSSFSQK